MPWPIPDSWVLLRLLGEEWDTDPDELRRTAPNLWVQRWLAWKESLVNRGEQVNQLQAQKAEPYGADRIVGL